MQDNNIQAILNKQRSDKFRLTLSLPKVLRSMDTSSMSTSTKALINLDSLQYSLYSTVIPAVSVGAKNIPYAGQTMRVTSQSRDPYEEIPCKFTIDNRFRNYWVLWRWLSILNDPRTGIMDSLLANIVTAPQVGAIPHSDKYWDYQTIISIAPLDEYNKSMCRFVYYNAFITQLSRIDFDYQTESEIQGEFKFAFGQMDIEIFDEIEG